MPEPYKQKGSKNYYADLYLWSEEERRLVRSRKSMGTDDLEQARKMAGALEATAKTARALAGQTISVEHADSLFTALLSTAGVTVTRDKPLPPLRAFLDSFMTARARKVSEGSMKAYRQYHRRFLKWLDGEARGEPALDWVSMEVAEAYYLELRESLSVKSSKENFKWLSRAMERGVERTSLVKNPCKGVELDSGGQTLDRLPFSLDEVKTIIGWLLGQEERQKEWARATMLSVMAAVRIEDVLTMDASAIVGGVLTYTPSKTEKFRKTLVVPLVIEDWAEAVTSAEEGPLFPTLAREMERWGNSKISSEFTGYVSNSGVEQLFVEFKSGRRIARKTFHSMRHTTYTLLIAAGCSSAQADAITGHSAGQGKQYTHSEIEASRENLKKAFNAD